MEQLTIQDIFAARERLGKVVNRTQLEYSSTISTLCGCEIYLKQENLQRTGSFKIRGAYNKMATLTAEEANRGVIAASAGNHAQGVALAARLAGISATVVMPQGAPIAKISATQGYGAQVELAGQSYDEAFLAALTIQKEKGLTYIHAFDDFYTMAGQGTIGLEVLEDLPEVDAILVPIGGGGLIAGIATVVKALRPETKVYGIQASGASAMYQSFNQRKLTEDGFIGTIADGIAVKRPGERTFPIIKDLVDDIVVVNDEEIAQAILLLLERSKVVAEGSGAIGIAAALQKKLPIAGKKVAVIISGGNIDVQMLSIIIERGLIKSGRRVRINNNLIDRPGALQKLLGVIAQTQANVISVNHDRVRPNVPLAQAEVELMLETRDTAHVREIVHILEGRGYKTEIQLE